MSLKQGTCMLQETHTVMKFLQGFHKYFLSNYHHHLLHHFFTSYFSFLSNGKINISLPKITIIINTNRHNITCWIDSTFSSSSWWKSSSLAMKDILSWINLNRTLNDIHGVLGPSLASHITCVHTSQFTQLDKWNTINQI